MPTPTKMMTTSKKSIPRQARTTMKKNFVVAGKPACSNKCCCSSLPSSMALERKMASWERRISGKKNGVGSFGPASISSLRLWMAIAFVGLHVGNGFLELHTRQQRRHVHDGEKWRRRPSSAFSSSIQQHPLLLVKVVPSSSSSSSRAVDNNKEQSRAAAAAGKPSRNNKNRRGIQSLSSSSSSSTKTKKKRRSGGSGNKPRLIPFERHEILTKEEERHLTGQIARARQVRATLSELLRYNKEEEQRRQRRQKEQQPEEDDEEEEEEEEESFLSDDEFYSKHYNNNYFDDDDQNMVATPVPLKYELLERHYQQSILQRTEADWLWGEEEEERPSSSVDDYNNANVPRNNNLWMTRTTRSSSAGATGSGSKKKRAGDPELSFFDDSYTNGAGRRSRSPEEEDDLVETRGYDLDALLQEDDIVDIVGLPGGRTELWQVLKAGASARDELIRSNLRLVSNIALQYCRRSVSSSWAARNNNNIDTASSSQQQDNRFGPSIYSDGWDRPSIYEAFQEGVLGLITAVERFEPARNLRFSTFATFWITNYVRQSFQTASTGALRLPSNMHDKKNAYYALLKQYKRRGEVPPPLEVLAKSLGVTEARLITILRVTQPLRSMDEPMKSTDPLARNVFTMVDTIPDDESPAPEELVDLSLLRQSLESLMAGVLAPHERDILRLRLGLDDGVDRSISDVVNVYDGRMTRKEVWTTEQMALRKLRIPMILERYQLLDAAALYSE